MSILGLAFSIHPDSDISIINSAATGFGILILMLLIAWLYEKVRKIDGMGGGDVKLLTAMGTFLGAINMSFIILISSMIAVAGALASAKTRKEGVPFGPFIVIATFLWVIFGNYILGWYIGLL